MDAYTSVHLDSFIQTQLDHVVEIHIVRDAYDTVTPQGTSFRTRKRALLQDLRQGVNETENLNYTSPDINNTKFRAFWDFQEDYRNGCSLQIDQGLFPYLVAARNELSERGRLSRSESKRIQEEVLRSSDFIIDRLQDENPLHAQVIESLHDNFTAMRIK